MHERDAEAFRALYRAHYRDVCRYLALRVDADAVEDLAAETFLVAWRRQPDLPGHVRPWLLNTAGKVLANDRRSRARRDALVERLAGAVIREPSAADAAELAGARRALVAAFAGLAELDRELLALRHWQGLPPREIAVVVGLGDVVTRARLHRAERRLRRGFASAMDGTAGAAESPTPATSHLKGPGHAHSS